MNVGEVIILTGPSGSGKTTIGKALAAATKWEFYDADWFHSSAAKEKMSRSEPLTDADRLPWLQSLQTAIAQWLQVGKNVILACSALKVSYRQILRHNDPRVKFVYLHGSYELIEQRLRDRLGHFMPANLLQSQFETLEIPTPDEAIHIDVSQDLEAIVHQIRIFIKA